LSPPLPSSLAPTKPANPVSPGKMAYKMERDSTLNLIMYNNLYTLFCPRLGIKMCITMTTGVTSSRAQRHLAKSAPIFLNGRCTTTLKKGDLSPFRHLQPEVS